MNKSLKEVVTHPATVITSVLTGVVSTLWLPVDPGILSALAGTLWANAGTLFTAGSTMAAPLRYGVIDAPWLEPVAYGLLASGGILYVAKLLDRFLDDFNDRLDE